MPTEPRPLSAEERAEIQQTILCCPQCRESGVHRHWCNLPDSEKLRVHELKRYEATVRQLEKCQEALRELVNQLEVVHNDARYKSVWALYAMHAKYEGPFYIDELVKARTALAEAGGQR